MNIATDMTIRQRFIKIIDSEEEAMDFGEESARDAYAFSKGFGEYDFELGN
jgi:hypothetical protein